MREVTAKVFDFPRIHVDVGQTFGRVVVVLAIVAAGGGIAAALPPGATLWMVVSSFLAPASLAFAVYWWRDQG